MWIFEQTQCFSEHSKTVVLAFNIFNWLVSKQKADYVINTFI